MWDNMSLAEQLPETSLNPDLPRPAPWRGRAVSLPPFTCLPLTGKLLSSWGVPPEALPSPYPPASLEMSPPMSTFPVTLSQFCESGQPDSVREGRGRAVGSEQFPHQPCSLDSRLQARVGIHEP